MEGDESGSPSTFPNMNPALNNVTSQTPGNVQVLNVLDVPQASNTLEQFAMADVGLLEGIPGGMFDWGVYHFMHVMTSSQIFMRHRAVGFVLRAVQSIQSGSRESGPRWYFWGDRRGVRWIGGIGPIESRCGGEFGLRYVHMCKMIAY